MKALTICQPYAHLIVTGEKRVENRTWPTNYRGPLIIHAGKSREWLEGDKDIDLFEQFGELPAFGAIVGQCNLVGCVRAEDIHSGSLDHLYPYLADRAHCNGPWCWVLDSIVRRDKPLPWRGQQGLFDIADADLEAACSAAEIGKAMKGAQ